MRILLILAALTSVVSFATRAVAEQFRNPALAKVKEVVPHKQPRTSVRPSRHPVAMKTAATAKHHKTGVKYANLDSRRSGHRTSSARSRASGNRNAGRATAHNDHASPLIGQKHTNKSTARVVRAASRVLADYSYPTPHIDRPIVAGVDSVVTLADSIASGGAHLIAIMKSQLGKNPTGWGNRWCGRYLDMTLRTAGFSGGGNLARSYASYGRPTVARPGAIAVLPHHVGVVMSVGQGYVTLISGNHSRRVGIGKYSMKKILAYRTPA